MFFYFYKFLNKTNADFSANFFSRSYGQQQDLEQANFKVLFYRYKMFLTFQKNLNFLQYLLEEKRF